MKRLLDVVVAAALLVAAIPLMLLTALMIRTFLGTPILFRQLRPGLYGKPFTLYKFRTMADVYDENGMLLPDEERLTAVGRWNRRLSLDELPQLFKVLKGDMSLVGPRPLLMEYLPLYSPQQARRHEVKPGITGWAQVNGRNALSWEERFALDVWYVDHCSFWLDIKILWMTLLKVFAREGVNQLGHATMPRFTGGVERGHE